MTQPATPTTPSHLSPIEDWGVIRATGADAASFLHGQLSHDLLLIKPDKTRLAAFCNAKGRMLASFIVVPLSGSKDDILLICSRDLLANTLKRLSMFVLRSKVKLVDDTAQWRLTGLFSLPKNTQSVSTNPINTGDNDVSPPPTSPWQQVQTQQTDGRLQSIIVTLPAAVAQVRQLCITPVGVDLPANIQPLPIATPQAWAAACIQSGVLLIAAVHVEHFVPQMLNYESVDGINFKKGCYPGQEVVARSQFRGAIKRRSVVLQSPQLLSPMQEVFVQNTSNTESQEADTTGVVLQCAPLADGQFVLLACVQTSCLEIDSNGRINGLTQTLTAGGAPLSWAAQPYTLKLDI